MNVKLLAVLLAVWGSSWAVAAEYPAASAEEIAKLTPTLKPGDVVVMKDGVWTDQAITFGPKGTAAAPITLKAATPGGVTLTGKSSVNIIGEHLIVSGLFLRDNTTEGSDGFSLRGNHIRLTDSAITGGAFKFQIHLIGQNNRVDHCYIAGKKNSDPTLQVEVDKEKPNNNLIDHNHFGHRPPLGKNGGETMRIGYSGQSQWNSRTTVEHNLFDRCDGEIEIISSKSCENVMRHNTFWECAGFLTLRHGHRCVVDSNYFIANHKEGSGGVRVINEGHIVINNYISGVDKGGFWITSGILDGPLTGYTRVKDALIAFNTVVDYAGPGVELAAGLGTSNRTLVPEDVTIANNIFAPGKGGTLIKGDKGKYEWLGNLAFGAEGKAGMIPAGGGKLVPSGDLMRPETPVKATAIPGAFPMVKSDVAGQPRGAEPQVGALQAGGGTPKFPPLTAKDVGPSWLPVEKRTE